WQKVYLMTYQRNIAKFWEWGRKIVCVGRNYVDHCAELKNPVPKSPLIFLKPTSSYVREGSAVKIPTGCSTLHHEVELGIVISKKGGDIQTDKAMDHVGGYVLALDMTARDWQDVAKSQGKPWSMAKGFDTACPVSDFIEKDKISDPHNIKLWLKVNNEMKQNGSTKDMIFNIPYLIHYVSTVMHLEEGDVILTGTPEGVGPVKSGDVMECGIESVISMKFPVQMKHY
uniref:Oxaloacetate tautomerase FAHD1, mitochondrial n=1 Tax=Ciona intestinalis TaxID=7719 RepID=H2Y0X5_CIOIN